VGRVAKELNAIYVSRLRQPGMHFVGGTPGLALQVLHSGGRSWVLRIRVHGKRRDMGLGSFPDISLSLARDLARDVRAKVKQGIDPIAERHAARSRAEADRVAMRNFKQCAERYITGMEGTWKNPKSPQQWRNTLETYAYPTMGGLAAKDIELSHVMAVLEPIWRTKTETASRLRGRIEAVLDWAAVNGLRSVVNPARWKGHLDKLLPARSKVKPSKHHDAVHYRDMNDAWSRLLEKDGIGAVALRFGILCASRSGEVRGATWAEFDDEQRLWVIPKERMKGKREHRVPLSDAAYEILKAMPRGDDDSYVFGGWKKGAPLSDSTMSKVLKDMGVPAVPHGFRSTFRDWASECTNFHPEMAEMALAHAVSDKVEAAYRRGDLLERRRQMMDEWAKFCGKKWESGVVVPLSSAGARAA
jgi:integrase